MEEIKLIELCPEFQKILKETPFMMENSLKNLKDWLQKSSDIKSRSDDQFLINFLRHCNYSLEETKQKLLNFYSMRSNAPKLMTNRDVTDETIMKIIELG